LDFAAWAEGERISFTATEEDTRARSLLQEESELDSQVLQAVAAGNLAVLQDWVARMPTDGKLRITRVFLSIADEAPEQTLQLLLATGLVDLSEIDEINHRNILHKAAISGRLLLLNIGLKGKVDVRAVDVYGRIPLHYACMHGSVDMIQGLVNAFPASIECKDHDRFTPLIHAIVHEKVDCVRILLEYHASINPDSERDHIPLNLACQHGSRSVVKLLLGHHPKIVSDAEGLYPQHLVARSPKAPQLLRMLKDYGADLDQKDKLYQWTPLFHASSEGNVECLRALLQCEVNVRILDEKGLSALYYATWEGHVECIQLLINANVPSPAIPAQMSPPPPPSLGMPPQATTPRAMSRDFDGIPQLMLPPAIIPIRRYGHNFLESKTFVVLDFGTFGQDSIQFYDDNKYPAARITVTSKSSDLIPRNLLLPIQDDSKTISFQIDNLETFSIEFDVYATFGARVIARAVASSKVFTSQSGSSGQWHLELLDPRLRAVGHISFSFLVIKPFTGIPLEISNFATYWKATGQAVESKTSPFIMGSSLSGDYVRLFVQLTRDKVPVFHPQWMVAHHGLDVPVLRLTLAQFRAIGSSRSVSPRNEKALPALHKRLATSFATLKEALEELPPAINVELHALYPSRTDEDERGMGPTPSMNDFADALLSVVFEYARKARADADGYARSVVFSSYNREICTALNWKQPNCRCSRHRLASLTSRSCAVLQRPWRGHGRRQGRAEQRRQRAQRQGGGQRGEEQQLHGPDMSSTPAGTLPLHSQLLLTTQSLAPPLIDTIKAAGLVLVADVSGSPADVDGVRSYAGRMAVSDRVDGIVRGNGVLTFMDSVDV
jgi:CDK inhibitor PHO81